MSKRIFMHLTFGFIVLLMLVVTARSYAGENVDRSKTRNLQKTMTNDQYRWFLINNIFNYYSNTGDGSINPNTGQSGFEFPKGSGKQCTFEDGIVCIL